MFLSGSMIGIYMAVPALAACMVWPLTLTTVLVAAPARPV